MLELLDLLEGAGAISGEFAAERWAPYLPAQSALIHCYRAETWERLTEDVGAPSLGTRRSHEGQLLLAQADEGVAHFGEVVDGFPLVHPAQAYVDLYPARGRGREAAEHLRRECLPY